MRRLLAALAVLAATLPAVPATAQEGPDENLVRVDVRAMSTALVPGTTERLVIRARAVNTTTETQRRLRVGLRFGAALRGRSAIANGGTPARLGTRVADTRLSDGELAPGATDEVEFDVPLGELPFHGASQPGIYPMRIEVRSHFTVVGAVDTYAMWWPTTTPRLRVAWLWPLVEPSHRLLGNDFADDDLAALVNDGRLDRLLTIGAGSGVPLTWAVDPELLDALHRMTGPYTVRGREGTQNAAARDWLDRAQKALAHATVLPLPYADPDVATTATAALAPDAGRAFLLGREVLRRDLGNAGDVRLAWPPGTTLDPAVEALLSGQGARGVVVPEAALPLSENLYYTPTAPTPLAPGALGSVTALVADAQLNGFVAAAAAGEAAPRLAAQRFLADTAMAALERPTDARDVVLTPPRTWDPVSDFAASLLAQTAAAPWLEPVGLDAMLRDEQSAAARTRTPGSRVLSADQVRRALEARRSLQRLRSILTDPKRAPDRLADLDDALLRAVSAQAQGTRLTDAVDAELGGLLGRVRVVTGGPVTMTGRSGKIPLTFQNDLGQTVRVKVRITSNGRLALEGRQAYERGQDVVVPPGSSTHAIKGRATTGGLFPVTVELLAADGSRIGRRETVRVRSTAYGAVALGVTGVAFGLLLVASATRLVRRRRGARRTAAPEAA